jgi:hypothetical protein
MGILVMVDLWNGIFGLVAAVFGGVVTGLFMRSQQKAEFRQRANEAVRALLVELEENRSVILDMQRRSSAVVLDGSIPARLKRLVWDAQLPLIAGFLDDAALSAVIKAYRSSDCFRGLIPNPDATYEVDANLNNGIIAMSELFPQAIIAVRRAASLPDRPKDLSDSLT